MIQPFTLSVTEGDLADFHHRIDETRWPAIPSTLGWDRGVDIGYLRELVGYWRHDYDWRHWESLINDLPQFTVGIDGADIHFLHLRSPERNALPLVLTHGWPGSFLEFLQVLGPLTDPRSHGGHPDDAFHVVIPSLPGFAMSTMSPEWEWDVPRIAAAWARLMNLLGYDQYGAQGGDWGSRVSWELGRVAPDAVVGVHVNMLVTPVPDEALARLDQNDVMRVERQRRFAEHMSGYMKLQSTRPLTLAYALTDSPVGQLAWIVEKFKEWRDPELSIDRDLVLTNTMLYWWTRSAGSSANLYYEHARRSRFGMPAATGTPTGVAVFPHDVVKPIRSVATAHSNIVHWSEFDRGGHFAALEQPQPLVEDVRKFFRGLR